MPPKRCSKIWILITVLFTGSKTALNHIFILFSRINLRIISRFIFSQLERLVNVIVNYEESLCSQANTTKGPEGHVKMTFRVVGFTAKPLTIL